MDGLFDRSGRYPQAGLGFVQSGHQYGGHLHDRDILLRGGRPDREGAGIAEALSCCQCAYTGSLTIPQAGHTDPIPALTLSLDKQTATGAGGNNGSGDVFAFSMVKTQ